MAIKSLSGSRKLVDLLSKLGHCASYSTIEEQETELNFESPKEIELTFEAPKEPN